MFGEGGDSGKGELGLFKANLDELHDLTAESYNGKDPDASALNMMDFSDIGNMVVTAPTPGSALDMDLTQEDLNTLMGFQRQAVPLNGVQGPPQTWSFGKGETPLQSVEPSEILPRPVVEPQIQVPVLQGDMPPGMDQEMMAMLQARVEGCSDAAPPMPPSATAGVQNSPGLAGSVPTPMLAPGPGNPAFEIATPSIPQQFTPGLVNPTELGSIEVELVQDSNETMDGENGNNDVVINEMLERLSRMNTLPQEIKPDRGAGMERDASGSFFLEDETTSRIGRSRDAAWNSDGELRERSSSAICNNVRRVSPGPASRFCHICARTQKTARHITCANFKRGECRKSVCEKCFNLYKWDWDAACQPDSDWVCTHCRNCCPSKARCTIYEKVNNKRREKSLSKENYRRRTPSSSPSRGPRGLRSPGGSRHLSPSNSFTSGPYFSGPPSPIDDPPAHEALVMSRSTPSSVLDRDPFSSSSDV